MEEEDKASLEHPFEDITDPGFLTPTQRRYLLGAKTYDDSAHDRQARKRLRERIKNGLLDFKLLVEYLDERDREQILGDETARVTDPHLREDELEGLVYAIAFARLIADDVDVPFEPVLEAGMTEAQQRLMHGLFDIEVDVALDEQHQEQVSIRPDVGLDLDDIAERIAAGEEINRLEYNKLVRLVLDDRERVVEAMEAVDLSSTEVDRPDVTLSRGESLVSMARVMQDESLALSEFDPESLHPDVRSTFGLDSSV